MYLEAVWTKDSSDEAIVFWIKKTRRHIKVGPKRYGYVHEHVNFSKIDKGQLRRGYIEYSGAS